MKEPESYSELRDCGTRDPRPPQGVEREAIPDYSGNHATRGRVFRVPARREEIRDEAVMTKGRHELARCIEDTRVMKWPLHFRVGR